MTNFVNNFDQALSGCGLYCVWIPVREKGRTHLEARWIDPNAEMPELTGAREEACHEAEAEEPWPVGNLQFA